MAKKKKPPPAVSVDEAIPRLPWYIVTAVSAGWGYFVLSRYYRRAPIRFDFAEKALGNIRKGFSSLSGGLVWEHLLAAVAAALVLACAVVAGGFALRALKKRDMAPGESRLFAASLGCGILAYFTLGLGALTILRPWAGWTLAAAVLFAGFRAARPEPSLREPARREVRSAGASVRSVLRGVLSMPLLDKAALLLLAAQTAHAALAALAPLIFYDSLVYHIGVPNLNILQGRLAALPYNLYAHMPTTVSFIFQFAMLLKDEMAAKLISFALGLMCCGGIYYFARRFWDGRVGLWAALIFYSLYHVIYISGACGTDVGITLFSMLAMYAFVVWAEDRYPAPPPKDAPPERNAEPRPRPGFGDPWLLLCGLFCGLAMASKYTAIYVPAAVMGTHLAFKRARAIPWSDLWKTALVLVALGTAVLAPWLVKNYVFKGNPVFPFMAEHLSPAGSYRENGLRHLMSETAQREGLSLAGLAKLPWQVTMGEITQSNGFTPLFLAVFPLLFLFKKYPSPLRWSMAMCALFALFWGMSTTLTRYLMPAFPFMSVIAAYWILRASLPKFVLGVFRAATLVTCLGGMVEAFLLTSAMEGWKYVLGVESKHDYLSRSSVTYPPPPYAVYKYANENLPADAKVLLIGEPRGTYLMRDHVAASVFDPSPFVEWAEASADGDRFYERLREEGVTHLLLNYNEARRSLSYKILDWKPNGWRVMQEFWFKHVREVHSYSEMEEGRKSNIVVLYEIVPGDGSEPRIPPPNYLLELTEATQEAIRAAQARS